MSDRRAYCPACRRQVAVRSTDRSNDRRGPLEAVRNMVRVAVYQCARCDCLVEADTHSTVVGHVS